MNTTHSTPPAIPMTFNPASLLTVCALLLVVGTYSAVAQGGSNYSTIGFGDMRSSYGAVYQGLGNVSTSTPNPYAINLNNPALWTEVKTTRLQSGYAFNQSIVSQRGSTVGNNNGKLDGASVIFALDTSAGISACMGVIPSSSINYIFTRGTTIPLPGGGSLNAQSVYAGSGGLISGFLGGAWAISDRLSFGAEAIVNFGVISDSISTSISSVSSDTAVTSNVDHLNNFAMRFGVQSRLSDDWTLGAAIGLNSKMEISSDISYRTTSNGRDSYDSVRTIQSSSLMPMSIALGTSYHSGKFLFVADGEYQNCSGVTYRLGDYGAWTNALRVGVGVSRLGTYSAGTAYWDKVNFNAGLGHQSLSYTFDGNQISENYLSVGAQMPFGGAAMIDLALSVGRRGTTQSTNISETFFRFNFGISVGEVWFIPFKRD